MENTISELMKGRPYDCTGRLDKEIRCYDLLDSLNIEYYRIDHPAAPSREACRGLDDVLGTQICKNLFLCNRKQTEFYLLMMPLDKTFCTSDVSHQVGSSRLSFASADYMQEYLDITPGSVSILGLMNDKEHKVRLLVDEDILNSNYVGCHPCINTSSLRFHTKDLFGPILKALDHEMTPVKLK